MKVRILPQKNKNWPQSSPKPCTCFGQSAAQTLSFEEGFESQKWALISGCNSAFDDAAPLTAFKVVSSHENRELPILNARKCRGEAHLKHIVNSLQKKKKTSSDFSKQKVTYETLGEAEHLNWYGMCYHPGE